MPELKVGDIFSFRSVYLINPRKRLPRCYQCGNRLGKRHLDSEICGDCERGIEGAALKRLGESELSATEEETCP